jgi:hypothetical protein
VEFFLTVESQFALQHQPTARREDMDHWSQSAGSQWLWFGLSQDSDKIENNTNIGKLPNPVNVDVIANGYC